MQVDLSKYAIQRTQKRPTICKKMQLIAKKCNLLQKKCNFQFTKEETNRKKNRSRDFLILAESVTM